MKYERPLYWLLERKNKIKKWNSADIIPIQNKCRKEQQKLETNKPATSDTLKLSQTEWRSR